MVNMFVCNIKLSRTKFFKGVLAIMAIVCVSLAGMGIFKMYSSNREIEFSSRKLHALQRSRVFDR